MRVINFDFRNYDLILCNFFCFRKPSKFLEAATNFLVNFEVYAAGGHDEKTV